MQHLNPFHELYVTESFDEEQFVQLFSPVLIEPAMALYKPGNVVLEGLAGTGKTMLLNLLKPKIRAAYHHKKEDFPIPEPYNKFISAGINLIRSGVSDFGNVITSDTDLPEICLMFGDFFNYWVLRDLLETCSYYSKQSLFGHERSTQKKNLEACIRALAANDCWFGSMAHVHTSEEFDKALSTRIQQYRKFMQLNLAELPKDVTETKTAIGRPLTEAVRLLKQYEVIPKQYNVFIRIDQFEELSWLDNRYKALGADFKAVVRKLFVIRDPNVSYKLGTRPYSWHTDTKEVYGTSAPMEEGRNYLLLSMSSFLRRGESENRLLFPAFCNDIFTRRVRSFGNNRYEGEVWDEISLKTVFGRRLPPKERAKRYVPRNPEKAVVLDKEWSETWKRFITNLAKEDPLSARFGEAWVRQEGKEALAFSHHMPKVLPWEDANQIYWRKDGTEAALIQIAARNQQNLIWSGDEEIVALSGENILAFILMCQCIWDAWLLEDARVVDRKLNKPIDPLVQTFGILTASNSWFRRLTEGMGGHERQTFVEVLGTELYKALTTDRALSYPGWNGFSMTLEDLREVPLVSAFLGSACDNGVLFTEEHTTRDSSKKKRAKFYLHQLLAPYFKLPVRRTKEPLYVRTDTVLAWMVSAGFQLPQQLQQRARTAKPRLVSTKPRRRGNQGLLFE